MKLRKAGVAPEAVAALLSQADLRERAGVKFGPRAKHMLFTQAGLEQATRAVVADLHAQRFVAAHSTRVADLGCGIGSESLALLRAGLNPVPVERDLFTASIAQHNLGIPVHASDAEHFPLDTVDGVFFDPARRTAGHRDTRRLTNFDDYSPSLDFAFEVAERKRAGIKLGPGFPHELIPHWAEAQWVSVDGSLVELSLWSGATARQSVSRSAAVITRDELFEMSSVDRETVEAPTVGLGDYIYEPDPAVIRSGLVAELAHSLNAGLISDRIAYLSSDSFTPTPFAQAFHVRELLPMREKELRKALAARDIGKLEIKKRGVDIEPASLRDRLHLKGTRSATIILTRVLGAHTALLVERVQRDNS